MNLWIFGKRKRRIFGWMNQRTAKTRAQCHYLSAGFSIFHRIISDAFVLYDTCHN